MKISKDDISIKDLITLFDILVNDTEIGKNKTFNVFSGREISVRDSFFAI